MDVRRGISAGIDMTIHLGGGGNILTPPTAREREREGLSRGGWTLIEREREREPAGERERERFLPVLSWLYVALLPDSGLHRYFAQK